MTSSLVLLTAVAALVLVLVVAFLSQTRQRAVTRARRRRPVSTVRVRTANGDRSHNASAVKIAQALRDASTASDARVTVVVHSRECGHCHEVLKGFEDLPNAQDTKLGHVLFVEGEELMKARQSELASAQKALLTTNAVPMYLVYDATQARRPSDDARLLEQRVVVGRIAPLDEKTVAARVGEATPERIALD